MESFHLVDGTVHTWRLLHCLTVSFRSISSKTSRQAPDQGPQKCPANLHLSMNNAVGIIMSRAYFSHNGAFEISTSLSLNFRPGSCMNINVVAPPCPYRYADAVAAIFPILRASAKRPVDHPLGQAASEALGQSKTANFIRPRGPL